MVIFDGLGMHLGNLARLSNAETRSISAENPTGERGRGGMATEGAGAIPGRELGQGWKISPSINIDAHETVTLADIDGSGAIQHIWLTVHPTHLENGHDVFIGATHQIVLTFFTETFH